MLSQYHVYVFFFFIDFHTHALQIFFSCLWQNVYTILFSFSERAWSQFYWLPRPREHNRVGSGLALRGVFHKMHFHQWELKCTSAIFTMFKPRTSFFFQLHCCTIVQQFNGNLTLLLVFQPTKVQLCNLNCRALLLSVERRTEGRNLRYAVVQLYDSATERK